MGFCILGGKETYLRKLLSDKLTSLGKTIGMGAAPAAYTEDIQEIYDERYIAGEDAGSLAAYSNRNVNSLGRKTNSYTGGHNSISWTMTAPETGRYIIVVRTYQHVAYEGFFVDNAVSWTTITSLNGPENGSALYVAQAVFNKGATIKARIESGTSANSGDCWVF